jgi:hypothetical protein
MKKILVLSVSAFVCVFVLAVGVQARNDQE